MTQVIAGYVALDGRKADVVRLDAMLEAFPAAEGTRTARRTALTGPAGFATMAIAARGAPDPDPDTTVLIQGEGRVVAADARLYGADGVDPAGAIMAALRTHGPAALAALHGDFTIAFWDETAGSLLLMRDRIGVRPLFHVVQPGRWAAFASHPAMLLGSGFTPFVPDLGGVAQRTYHRDGIGARTHIAGLSAVEAAHAVTVTGTGAVRARRMWQLPILPHLDPDTDPDALAAELRGLLDQAVTRRLPASGDGFGHVSGGLDSTPIGLIAAQALTARGNRFHAYSVHEPRDLPGIDPGDEKANVDRALAGRDGIEAHTILPLALSDGMAVPDRATLLDQSPMDEEQRILRDAAGRGASAIFSGWVGDEVTTFRATSFGEAEMFLTGRFRATLRQLRKRQRVEPRSLPWLFLTRVLLRMLPLSLRNRLSGMQRPPDPVLTMLRQPFHDLLTFDDRGGLLDSRYARRRWLEHYGLPATLQRFALLGMPHGIAYTFPMADLDLIALGARIPNALNYDGENPRMIYRRAVADLLPHAVLFAPNKLIPLPLGILRTVRARDALIAQARRLGANPAVRAVVDTDAIVAYLAALPEEEALLAALREDADAPSIDLAADHFQGPLAVAAWIDRYGTDTR